MPDARVQTLREARVARLLTIRDLASRAGVSPYTVHQLERGARSPRFGTIRRISAALELQPEAIAEFRSVLTGGEETP